MNSSETVSKPTHEQIALRAELLWKAKGSPSGQDDQIWHEAERQLYDEAKEVFSNSAASAPSSLTSSTQNSSGSSSSSGGSTPQAQPAPSVASEKMAGKNNSQKSGQRRR